MATIKFTYGDVQDHANYIGEENTISVDTEKKTLRVHDGVTPGGSTLATEEQLEGFINSNVEIVAGDGLVGGGSLDGDTVTISVGTPTTITGATINESSANSHSHAISINKNDVGLSNVDNTSDLNKPVSNATQTALNAKVNTSDIGVTVAALVNGKVPLSQMDDSVLGQVEYKGTWNATTNAPTLPATPAEKGIYYVVSTGGTFQSISFAVGDWIISNGSVWQKVDNTDAVTSVAGKTGAVTLTKTDVGLSNVDNTSDLNKPISTATQAALNAKAPLASPVFTGNPEVPTQLTSDNSKKVANTEFVKAVVDAKDVGVTVVSGTAPINVSGGTSTPTVSISPATQSSAGSMSAADKSKLDGIQAGAEQNTVDSVAGKTGDVALSASDIGGLGTAATANLTTSAFDTTAGSVLKNGDWGIPTNINMWTTPHANAGGDTGTDLNTLTTAGWWRKLISPSSINRPSGGSGYWYLLVLKYAATDNITQVAFPYGTTTENGNIQYRHCYGGIWGAWRTVYDSINQIALGSTLSSARTVLGISNVDNTSDLNKPVSTATQNALNLKANLASPVFTGTPTAPTPVVADNSTKIATTAHVKMVVGEIDSGVVSVTGEAPVTVTGTSSNPVIGVNNATTSVAGAMSAADKAKLDGIAAGAQVNTVTSVAGKTGAVTLTKNDVGLSNVDNTSDLNKPVSTATQTALNNKLDATANAVSASKLATARTITLTGDVAGSASFDGSGNVSINAQVANDSHTHSLGNLGLGTAATKNVGTSSGDVVEVGAFGLGYAKQAVDFATRIDSGFYLSTVGSVGQPSGMATDGGWMINLNWAKDGTGNRYNCAFYGNVQNNFIGFRRINQLGEPQAPVELYHTGNINTANAGTATKLANARTIGGVSFDGSANINLPGVNAAGNQSTTGNAATATELATARTLTIGSTGKTFNGSANVSWTLGEIGAAAASHAHEIATTSTNGFMSAADKAKLDSLSTTAGISEDDAIVLALIFG